MTRSILTFPLWLSILSGSSTTANMSCKNSIIKNVRGRQTKLADAAGVPSEEDEEERG